MEFGLSRSEARPARRWKQVPSASGVVQWCLGEARWMNSAFGSLSSHSESSSHCSGFVGEVIVVLGGGDLDVSFHAWKMYNNVWKLVLLGNRGE